MNPVPFIVAAVLGGAAYMLGGTDVAAWTLIGWGAFVALVTVAGRK